MTRIEFEEKKLRFDREFSKQSRRIKRTLDKRYSAVIGFHFRSKIAQQDYAEQLNAAKEAELEEMLQDLWEDIEADLFGSMGIEGVKNSLLPANRTLGISVVEPNYLLEHPRK